MRSASHQGLLERGYGTVFFSNSKPNNNNNNNNKGNNSNNSTVFGSLSVLIVDIILHFTPYTLIRSMTNANST